MTKDPVSEAMRSAMTDALSRFDYRHAGEVDLKKAAVALTIVDAGHGADIDGLPITSQPSDAPALVLTRRAATLRAHAGQWALPGGRLDAGETIEQAALRELHEEVGVELGAESVLGRLDDFVTRSGFVMSPVVVWGGPIARMQANPEEVASIHRIPLSELDRSDAPLLSEAAEGEHPVLRMPVGSDSIAAPTAAILYQFREVILRGLSTRVAHYEQPDFAWK
ncbi:MAG: CoA pyrophosphatase [Pseudomonadaceae bacterium]|nr:CoA pyrophosphatase [Pseudomonadaceae bacterium]